MATKWLNNATLQKLRHLRKTNKQAYYEELSRFKDQVSRGVEGFYLKFPKTESLGHMNWVLRQEGFNKGKIRKDSLFPIDYEKIAYSVNVKEAIDKKKKILQQRLKPEEYQRFVKRIDEKYEKFNNNIKKDTNKKLQQINNISSSGSNGGGGGGGSLGGLLLAGAGAATVLGGGAIYLAANSKNNLALKNKYNSKENAYKEQNNNDKYVKLKKEKK